MPSLCLFRAVLVLVLQAPIAQSFASTDQSVKDDSAEAALALDDDCMATNGAGNCAFSAMQLRRRVFARTLAQNVTSKPLSKLRRSARFDESPRKDRESRLEGAAFADYAVDVTVGGQTFQVTIDTGSSEFAVAAAPLTDCSEYLSPSSDGPGHCDGPVTTAKYGSGSWSGRICNGYEVSLAGLSAGTPAFAGIFSQKHFLQDCHPEYGGIVSEGILGLAYWGLMSFSGKPLFDSVVDKSGVPDVFSMQCCGWNGHTPANGQFVIGGVDHNLYKGEIQYTPITQETYYCVNMISISSSSSEKRPSSDEIHDCNADTGGTCFVEVCDASRGRASCQNGACMCDAGYCALDGRCQAAALMQAHTAANRSDDLDVNPRIADLLGIHDSEGVRRKRRFAQGESSEYCNSIIDSGTSDIVLHSDLYKKVMGPIIDAAMVIPSDVKCITNEYFGYLPDITIEFGGGVVVRVPPSTYFQPRIHDASCMSIYIMNGKSLGLKSVPPNIIGQPLMEAYYTVFDRVHARVGFAPIAGCPASV